MVPITRRRSNRSRPFARLQALVAIMALGIALEAAPQALESFSDPAEAWGSGVEAALERAYRECLKTYIIDGQVMTLRMPFAQNNERSEIAGADLEIVGGGKADPALIWESIDGLLESADFSSYIELLGDGRDKVIVFDLPSRSWTASRDIFDIARMKAGAYRGLPHRPYVLSSGSGALPTDVYNYLYCVGRIGMDCSGFVWHALSSTARAGGLDLGRALGKALRAPRGADSSLFAGTSFFDSRSPELIRVEDRISSLRPGDIMLFRGDDGTAVHSAVVQSVDLSAGRVRYLQCTDEAPPMERGVHESFILFDPAAPHTSLKDPSLKWSQARFPPFTGERPSAFSGDGERYRAFPEFGGGKVVRLRAMAAPIRRLNAAPGR
ncbi:MAG: peptidoglycan endopeptidase [Spirochaetes bacterium]|nr:peptidoglycan endopeptidase [Spirochaetota bacterium]